MSSFNLAALATLLASLSTVSAHGKVSGIIAGGVYHPGYTINYAYSPSHPDMPAWAVPEDKDTGFINPGNFDNPDVICHKGATPGELYATVAAGSTVELQWTEWPESHHGPVIDYLANCNGECTTVDKTALKFNKIDEAGLNSWTSQPGNWASDDLIAANMSWTVTIPENVAPGNYVLRHEIIALHSAHDKDGAQNYPQCVNLKVTGAGTDKLASGTPGMELYTPEDAGIFVNIYNEMTGYTIPGPKLYSGASPSTQPETTTSVSQDSSPATSTSVTSPQGTGSSPSSAVAPYPTNIYNSTSPISHTPGKKQAGKKSKSKKPCSSKTKATSVPATTSTTVPSAPSTSSSPSTPSDNETPFTKPEADADDADAEPETDSPAEKAEEKEEEEEQASTTPPPKDASPEKGDTPMPSLSALTNLSTAELFARLDAIIAELKSRLGSKKMRRHGRDFLGL
ncbi:MAG: hypothetical protein Q9205_003095 [Flavoplaca limonia]